MRAVPININTAGRISIDVRITGMRQWRVRCWLMMQCFKLAAFIAPKNVDVDVETL